MANFTELDRYLFGQATHYDIYRKLGAHFAEVKGVKGVYFDLWAPNAERVFLIGSFNGWNETANEMTRLKPETMGIYELFIPGLKEGELYKYLIETKDGKRLYKADPYANYAELRPGTASAIADIEHFKWTDSKWMENRKKEEDVYAQPMAIYEVHPGSWKHWKSTGPDRKATETGSVIGSSMTLPLPDRLHIPFLRLEVLVRKEI